VTKMVSSVFVGLVVCLKGLSIKALIHYLAKPSKTQQFFKFI